MHELTGNVISGKLLLERYIPDTSSSIIQQVEKFEKQITARVVVIGAGEGHDFKIGDKVIVSKFHGVDVVVEGDHYILVDKSAILYIY